MSETFRKAKLEKFVQKQIYHMASQEKAINAIRSKYPKEQADDIMNSVILNQVAWHNYTIELCHEFSIPMPDVPGVAVDSWVPEIIEDPYA